MYMYVDTFARVAMQVLMVAGTLMFSIANLLHALYIVLTSGVGKNGSTVAVSILHYPVYPGMLCITLSALACPASPCLPWHALHHPVCPGMPCITLSACPGMPCITLSALACSAVLEPTTYLGLPVHDCVLRSFA